MTFPQFAVSRWIGHSITISGKHYANAVPDELFERAAKATPTKATPCAQRQAQRKASDGAGNEQKQGNDAERAEARNSADFRDLRLASASPGVSEEWSRGESNALELSRFAWETRRYRVCRVERDAQCDAQVSAWRTRRETGRRTRQRGRARRHRFAGVRERDARRECGGSPQPRPRRGGVEGLPAEVRAGIAGRYGRSIAGT